MLHVKVIKKPDDPLCPRISAGGDHEIGFYLVFRGTREEAVTILEETLQALTQASTVILHFDENDQPVQTPHP
jgi:hypothetical protein